MDRERWRRLSDLYHAARSLPVDARARFLVNQCGGDESLRSEVESLLAQPDGTLPAVAGSGDRDDDLVGKRLGHYDVRSLAGAGGMGQVYRARDTRLGRDVALKVLPPEWTTNPDRLARLDREARMLAALNHPNIATIHGLEDAAALRILVLEYIEGDTLADRIAQRPLQPAEALTIARQVADALEAAHERGIVHRDLKPANIKITPAGLVKVLDFGLATLEPVLPGGLPDSPLAPTVTSRRTSDGVVAGTAAYMSPEQARGLAIDKRTDIWAFGCVLYEMLTARRAFPGDTISDTIVAVVSKEPDWTPIPRRARRLLQSCLEKDPRKRLRDIADAWQLLDEDSVGSTTGGARPAAGPLALAPWLLGSLIAALALIAGVLAFVHFREAPAAAEPVTFHIPPPPNSTFETALAVSPEGRRIAFTARDADGLVRIWVRDLGALEARPIAGTEDAQTVAWSPDGRSVAFAAGQALKRTGLEGGPTLTVYEAESPETLGAAAWSPLGVIIIGGVRSGAIRVVGESGGPVSAVTSLDQSRGELVHGIPALLPDGRHFVYVRVGTDPEASGLFLGSIDRKPEEQQQTRLLAAANALFTRMASGSGALVYLRQSTLVAHPFDPERLTLTGQPVPIAEGVGNVGSLGFFSVGAGIVAYRSGTRVSGGRESQLTWVDRTGRTIGVVGSATAYDGISLSPDGARAAVIQAGLSDVGLGNVDIWLVDAARGVSQRLTSSPGSDRWPVWSPRGERIAFSSRRAGQAEALYVTASSGVGAEELLVKSDVPKSVTSWSRDGRFLLFSATNPTTGSDVFLLPFEGDRQPVPIVQSTFGEFEATFSADTEWIAYTSDVSGRPEIYVRPFDAAAPTSAPGSAILVSRDGGRRPRWRRDGRELIFQSLDGSIMSVDITPEGGQVRPGTPKALFTLPLLEARWDVTGDGQQFLVTMPTVAAGLTPITVMMNAGVFRP